MILGFTGSRAGMTDAQRMAFEQLLSEHKVAMFMHGDCVGADKQAHDIVEANYPGISILVLPSLDASLRAWCRPRKGVVAAAAASADRNASIARISQLLVATPRTPVQPESGFIPVSGTEQTIGFARAGNKKVVVINPDGETVILT